MLLNTESENTILQSLGYILEWNEKQIFTFLKNVEINFNDSDLPETQLYKQIKASIKSKFDVSFYHATRTKNPNAFMENGIINLKESIFLIIDQLVDDKTKIRDIHEYCLKNNKMYNLRFQTEDYGPCAFLFREFAINPEKYECHNYLKVPEIIQNICDTLDPNGKMMELFKNNSFSTVVKFRINNPNQKFIGNVLFYIKNKIDGNDCFVANTFYDSKGKSISKNDILDIEKIEN